MPGSGAEVCGEGEYLYEGICCMLCPAGETPGRQRPFPPMSGGWATIPHSIREQRRPSWCCRGRPLLRGGILCNKGWVRRLGSSSEKSLPILRMKCSKSGGFFVSNSWPRGILIVLRVELHLAFVLPISLLVQSTQLCAEKYPAFG